MKTATAFSVACNAFPVGERSSRFLSLKPRRASALHRMKLGSKRFASLILTGFARAVVTADMPPAVAVKAKMGEVLSMMQRVTNKTALPPLVEKKLMQRFDFSRMARLALGAAWLNADRQQKQALRNGCRALLVRTYAAPLMSSANGGVHFEVKPVRHSNADGVTVKTLVKQSGKPSVAIDYRMEIQSNRWKVYEVLVDGVSPITRYRETFAEAFQRSGIAGLIDVLKATNRALALSAEKWGSDLIFL